MKPLQPHSMCLISFALPRCARVFMCANYHLHQRSWIKTNNTAQTYNSLIKLAQGTCKFLLYFFSRSIYFVSFLIIIWYFVFEKKNIFLTPSITFNIGHLFSWRKPNDATDSSSINCSISTLTIFSMFSKICCVEKDTKLKNICLLKRKFMPIA